MSAARILKTTVRPGGKIEVLAPDLPVGLPVEVTVNVTDADRLTGKSILRILAECPGGVMFKAAEEVDTYIREERDSWNP